MKRSFVNQCLVSGFSMAGLYRHEVKYPIKPISLFIVFQNLSNTMSENHPPQARLVNICRQNKYIYISLIVYISLLKLHSATTMDDKPRKFALVNVPQFDILYGAFKKVLIHRIKKRVNIIVSKIKENIYYSCTYNVKKCVPL